MVLRLFSYTSELEVQVNKIKETNRMLSEN